MLNHFSIPNIGPTKEIFQIQNSYKDFKNFISECSIPHIPYIICSSENDVKKILIHHTYPLLIKTNKDINNHIIKSLKEGFDYITKLYKENNFESIIIEEYLEGEKYKIVVLTDGKEILPLLFYKKNNHDYCYKNFSKNKVMFLENNIHQQLIIQKIIHPLLNNIKNKLHTNFKGIINISCIIHNKMYIPLNISFHFEHSTTTFLLNHLKTDLYSILINILKEKIYTQKIEWDLRSKFEIIMDEFNNDNI